MWQTGPSPEQLRKDAFVAAWLRHNDPWTAAVELFGAEIGVGPAMQISAEWPKDAYCIAKRKALLEEFGLEHFLPTQAEFAQMLLTEAKECKQKQDKHKFMELYAKTMKYISNEPPKSKNDGKAITVVASELDQSL